MSYYSNLVSAYSTIYKSNKETASELGTQEEVLSQFQSILKQSGFSKHKHIYDKALINAASEYQNQVKYLLKVFDGLNLSVVAKNTAADFKDFTESSIGLQTNQLTETIRSNSSNNEVTTIIPTSIGRWFTISLLQKILIDDFIAGETSASEEYIETIANEHGWLTTMNWLNTIYHDYYSNSSVLIGLMHCLSHFKYEDVKPAGPTMALGVLQHEDIYVRDYAIRAFENWNDKEAIPTLKAISCDAKWLQDYIDKVIKVLEG